MKKAITLILILIFAIIIAGIYISKGLYAASEELEINISAIEAVILARDWEKAEKLLAELKSEWAKTRNVWAMLIDHGEIDNIDMSFSKLAEYIFTKELPLAMAEASVLKQLVKHIPEKESFRLQNIL